MIAIKLPVKNIEEVRQILLKMKIIDLDYKIKIENSYGFIPLKEELSNETKNTIEKEIAKTNTNFNISNIEEIKNIELESIKRYPRSITDLLKDKLTNKEIEELKKSFDIIGNVVILEIPENLQNHKKDIGEATLKFTGRKTVYMKKSAIEGITRTRKMELIAGIDNPITIHKEHGTRLKLDVKNVYFSPRLATERKRVADLSQDGEEILDMFAGIGPFPIVIAKETAAKITAIDINEVAIKYLKENIKLNKLKEGSKIIAICGDTKKVAKEQLKDKKYDRLIMNLPGLAPEFLDLAVSLTENNGIIHYYEFAEDFNQGINRAKESVAKQNKEVEILNCRKVKSSSPGMWHVAIDCKIIDK